MAANVYECMFLLDTTKVSGDVQGAAEKLHKVLEKNNVEILASRPWNEQRLAYPIAKQKKGLYYLTYFRAEGENITPLESDLKLNEMILRLLILKIDPKLVDTMLSLARDEHALVALQNYQEEVEPTPNRTNGVIKAKDKENKAEKAPADKEKEETIASDES